MSVHSSSFVADRLSLPDALARWPKRLRKSPGNSRPYLDGNVTSHQLRNRHLRPCHHMQPILDHIAAIVRPGLRNYATAEKALTDAQLANDAVAIADARREVILAARQAVDGLHHLADFVFNEPSPALPKFRDLEAVRRTVEAKCIFLREPGVPVKDVTLLRDVAVAFKHHRPTRGSVGASTDIVPEGVGFGAARFGEGKFDGVEQVMATTENGDKRALSSILQNVFDAWMVCLQQPLLPINEF